MNDAITTRETGCRVGTEAQSCGFELSCQAPSSCWAQTGLQECEQGPPSLESPDSPKGAAGSCLSFIILIPGDLPNGGLVNV